MNEYENQYANLIFSIIWKSKSSNIPFTKEEITKLVKEHEIDTRDCNELGDILLWEEDYITSEEFAKRMDLDYENGDFYYIGNFDDFGLEKYESEILGHDYDWDPVYDYDANISDWWSSYDNETLKAIIEYCNKKGEMIDEIKITKNNTKIVDNDIIIEDSIKLSEQLSETDELKTILNHAILETQENADYNEVYDKIKDAFEDAFGKFEWLKNETIKVKLNVDWDDIKSELIDDYFYRGEIDFIEEYYGDWLYIMKEHDLNKFSAPNYDYIYGTIEDKYLNEITRERLSW